VRHSLRVLVALMSAARLGTVPAAACVASAAASGRAPVPCQQRYERGKGPCCSEDEIRNTHRNWVGIVVMTSVVSTRRRARLSAPVAGADVLRQLAALLRAHAAVMLQLLAISGTLSLSLSLGHSYPQGPSGSGAAARNGIPLHDQRCSTMQVLSKASRYASATK
jgi:hypothetical protein